LRGHFRFRISCNATALQNFYGRFWRYAKIGQIFIAQKAFVAATQASHMHDKFRRLAHVRH
jgi:hypothetical protein